MSDMHNSPDTTKRVTRTMLLPSPAAVGEGARGEVTEGRSDGNEMAVKPWQ